MMKRILSVVFSTIMVFVLLLSCAACGEPQEQDAPDKKLQFEYSMSALTVAIDRSRAKIKGEASSAVMDPSGVKVIPTQKEIEARIDEYIASSLLPKFTESYLYAIKIVDLVEFVVEGDFSQTLIGEYCGSGPYRVILANYQTRDRYVRVTTDSDHGTRIEYGLSDDFTDDGSEGSAGRYLVIEGQSGRLFNLPNGGSHRYDENNALVSATISYRLFSYSSGLDLKAEPELPAPAVKTQIVIEYGADFSNLKFSYQTGEGIEVVNGFCDADSLKYNTVNDTYSVQELTVPEWYVCE